MRKINFKKIGLAVAMLLSAFTFQSCNDDDDTDWSQVLPNALVTVKQNGNAYSFWGKQMPMKAKAKSRVVSTASLSTLGNDSYYVFNNDAGGFFIIAGDDAVSPVYLAGILAQS